MKLTSTMGNLYVQTIRDLKSALQFDYSQLGELSSTEKLKLSQMTALLNQLEQSTVELKKGLKTQITSHLIDTGKLAYNELFYEAESKNGAINFALLKDDELKTIIETPVANFKLSDRLNDGVVEKLKANIKDDLTRIFLGGASYPKAAARLAEQGYSSYRRAMMITRTEAGRVQAITRQKSQIEAEKLGIDFEKQWVATLDKRTRHNHAELDGVRVNPDGYFRINGHKTKQPHMFGIASEDIACRCRTISVLVDEIEPMQRRDNETGKIVEYKNYRDWERNRIEPKRPKTKTKAVPIDHDKIVKDVQKPLQKPKYIKSKSTKLADKPRAELEMELQRLKESRDLRKDKPKTNRKPNADYYSMKSIDKMSEEKLKKVAKKLSIKYHESGRTGISTNFTPEEMTDMLLAGKSKSELKKDVIALQRRLKKFGIKAKG
ncbi:phage minor head protein [Streptococcus ictaluri]|uniref:Phage Mu protein F-like protein n=1 Tax=Streptococcus ictaluri 707-05 TaxID=764299 RepID=G5K3S1_9STRE|nr:phage Mu protein F-like protein [Streptococcus ictaluri]EHI69389.1 phage Mu protein F-like protein [Streptococcus ictaluri 707-05]